MAIIAALCSIVLFFNDLFLKSLLSVNLARLAHLRCLLVGLSRSVRIVNLLATAEESFVLFVTLGLFSRLDVINFALVWMFIQTEHISAIVQDCTLPAGMITGLHGLHYGLAQDFVIDEC